MRAVRAFVLTGAVIAAAAVSAAGAPTTPVVQHPDPFLTNLTLDYTSPVSAPGGGAATFAPLGARAIDASVHDLGFLHYRSRGDWGGFLPAPVGWLAVETGGRVIVGARQKAGLPLFASQADGSVQSFTYRHDVPSHDGAGNVGSGPVVPPPPAPPTAAPPSGNGCFGGCTAPPAHHQGHGLPIPNGGAGSCGTAGLAITSDRPHCRIFVVDRKPGDAGYEHVTVTNTSSSPYVLSLEAVGTPESTLSNDLELGIWRTGDASPDPLPPLRFWTTQYTPLATLSPGTSVRLTLELRLPTAAGNGAQRLSAVVDFLWRAVPASSG